MPLMKRTKAHGHEAAQSQKRRLGDRAKIARLFAHQSSPTSVRIGLVCGLLLLAYIGSSLYHSGSFSSGSNKKNDLLGGTADVKGEGPITTTVTRALVADVPVSIDAVGTVQALNTVTIRTQVDGRLLRLAFSEGQDVHKDDILAEIDPALYLAQYEQAVAKKAQDEANLANARIDLARYEKLIAAKYASHQQYSTQKALVQQLEAQVRADQAALDSAKTTLDYATIRSPIDGRAGIRLVDVGNLLKTTDQTALLLLHSSNLYLLCLRYLSNPYSQSRKLRRRELRVC